MPGDHNDIMESISSMSLDYKKWKFDAQESLTDFVSAGKIHNFWFFFKLVKKIDDYFKN